MISTKILPCWYVCFSIPIGFHVGFRCKQQRHTFTAQRGLCWGDPQQDFVLDSMLVSSFQGMGVVTMGDVQAGLCWVPCKAPVGGMGRGLWL